MPAAPPLPVDWPVHRAVGPADFCCSSTRYAAEARRDATRRGRWLDPILARLLALNHDTLASTQLTNTLQLAIALLP